MSAQPITEITIKGLVLDKEKKQPLSHVTIKAINQEIDLEIQKKTVQDGTYEFRLPPGKWKITASQPGYELVELEGEFKADVSGQDFHLPPGCNLKGTVLWNTSKERVSRAIVKAIPLENQISYVRYTQSDGDGDFDFSMLEKGKWNLVGMHEGSLPGKPVEVNVDKDIPNFSLYLDRRMGTHDARWGWGFLIIISLLLVSMVLLYIRLHAVYRPEPDPQIKVLANLLAQGIKEVQALDKPSDVKTLAVLVATVNDTWIAISTNTKIFPADEKKIVNDLLAKLEMGIQQDEKTSVLASLEALKLSIEARMVSGFFWIGEPWRFLEVLFWGLAGILVFLISQTGYYLRWERFYIQGLPMHISQAVTIPLIALVFVLLLSQVSFNLTLTDSTVQLDISDPRILAAVSFILASQPWDLIKFLRRTSESLTGKEETEPKK